MNCRLNLIEGSPVSPVVTLCILEHDCGYELVVVVGNLFTDAINKVTVLTVENWKGTPGTKDYISGLFSARVVEYCRILCTNTTWLLLFCRLFGQNYIEQGGCYTGWMRFEICPPFPPHPTPPQFKQRLSLDGYSIGKWPEETGTLVRSECYWRHLQEWFRGSFKDGRLGSFSDKSWKILKEH